MNWTTLFKKFTNGKYIVGLLAVAFLSIGSFTNASSETITRTEGEPTIEYTKGNYNPNNITLYENIPTEEIVTNYNCETIICTLNLTDISCRINYNSYQGTWTYDGCTETINAGNYTITDFGNDGFSSITLNLGQNQNGTSIIEGGTSNFTPIITKLGNIAGEFIPYMLYIAIACLGISLVYGALKYILGYLQSKAKGAVRGK